MGYNTDFEGSFKLSRRLEAKEANFIKKFNETRRLGRNVDILMERFKGKDGLPFIFRPSDQLGDDMKSLETEFNMSVESGTTRTPEEIYGKEGEYYVGNDDRFAVIDYNTPPNQTGIYGSGRDFDDVWNERKAIINSGKCQPGLWCGWTINYEGTEVIWDGSEKFYEYINWIKYMITHFFEPWGIKLNGEMDWFGEDSSDTGKIIIKNNIVGIE